MTADEAVMFADAVHAARWMGCWAPKEVTQSSGRNRPNIHSAIDLETGQTRMLDVTTADAVSTIQLVITLMAMYPSKRVLLFLDNARYHHGVDGCLHEMPKKSLVDRSLALLQDPTWWGAMGARARARDADSSVERVAGAVRQLVA